MLYNLTITKPYEHILPVWQEILYSQSEDFYLRKSEATDGMILDVREEQLDTFDPSDTDTCIRMHAGLNLLTPMNYALFYKEDLLLLITVMAAAQKVGEISFLVDKKFVTADPKVKLMLLRAFNKALPELPFYRLQAKVKNTFEAANKFVLAMNFKPEGNLEGYGGQGVDYTMYSRICTKE